MAASLSLPQRLGALHGSYKCVNWISCYGLLLLVTARIALPQTLVTHLPGFEGTLPFKLETGYISVGEFEDVELFYYFVESQGDPESDSLILWQSGGPGCTGFSGLVYEIGPIKFDFEAGNANFPVLLLNDYAWTQMANIVFLDAPVGAGFSYTTSAEEYISSDTKSAAYTYEFLRKWLVLHPQFLRNPLYMGGDSHSGITATLLVDKIAKGNIAGNKPHMNLQGYILGNPLTDKRNKMNSRVEYYHMVGLIPKELYQSAGNSCNGDFYDVDPNNTQCLEDLLLIDECTKFIFPEHILEPMCTYSSPKEENPEWRRTLLEDPDFSNISVINDTSSGVQRRTLWCRIYNYLFSYIWANSDAVRVALHVRNGTKLEWKRCNYSIPYTQNIESVVEIHRNISLTTNFRVLIYSGDHDPNIPYVGTRQWIKSLDVITYDRWRPWFVDSQIAGYVEVYTCQTCVLGGYTLTFPTVKGAGHTAPEYKPRESYAMIERWLAHYFL